MISLKDMGFTDERCDYIRTCCVVHNAQYLKEIDFEFKDIGRHGQITRNNVDKQT